MGYETKNYEKQGGDEWVVSGTLTVEAGATVNVSGAFILPTADPHVAGALWNNSGTITVSAG
ncbi:hypothetical protein KP003_16675 [Geomonas nitrogeniifigens]|uniref:hypothetical protein n=1 Tax=Geomonas diazotrophica TaxID=2843197 RepID=UPI001C2BD7B1|nr:hypothetical protein [Geomonas nitrogeniifigens]QXE85976.1 hypothetical protein KP003_16675 [Geomonas nitrogeniifigens]